VTVEKPAGSFKSHSDAKLAEDRVEQIFRRRLAFRLVISSRKATLEISQPHRGWSRFKNFNVLKGRRNGSIFQRPFRTQFIPAIFPATS
jgi:hypothetical protein